MSGIGKLHDDGHVPCNDGRYCPGAWTYCTTPWFKLAGPIYMGPASLYGHKSTHVRFVDYTSGNFINFII